MRWSLAIALCVFIIIFVGLWIAAFVAGWKGNQFIGEHFIAIVGLPSAAALASCIVVIFRQEEGPIEFEAVFIKLKGAAGPVVLWVLCFLAIVGAIKMLW